MNGGDTDLRNKFKPSPAHHRIVVQLGQQSAAGQVVRYIEPAMSGTAGKHFVGEMSDVFDEALEGIAARADSPDDFLQGADGLRGGLGNFIGVNFDLGWILLIGFCESAEE